MRHNSSDSPSGTVQPLVFLLRQEKGENEWLFCSRKNLIRTPKGHPRRETQMENAEKSCGWLHNSLPSSGPCLVSASFRSPVLSAL